MAVAVPPLALTPWVWFTGGLAALGLQTNWFAPMLTACLSAVIGGAWIGCAGLSPRAAPVAATWPLVGLAAMFVLAKAVAAGTLFFIDHAVAVEGRMLRAEAAQIMATALPPAPPADANAAPIYQRAFAALAADQEVDELVTADVASGEVAALLERHAATLDLLRRATEKPGCRFDREWSQPSIDMLLPELQAMRRAARLLTLAARRGAADGDAEQALADVVRIHRLGIHGASEPILVSGLVGQAIDTLAITTLADVLPQLETSDLPLLDKAPLRDFVGTPIRYQRAFLGEEAVGLATLADLADGTRRASSMELLRSIADEAKTCAFDATLSLLYRCFLLPADIAGYRAIIHRYQSLIAALASPTPKPFAEWQHEAVTIEDDLKSRKNGILNDDGWVVYSVGPDGEDDGGPVPAGDDAVEGNDDVGLRLAF